MRAVRARRRQRDPARGPGFSQALRAPRRQGADPSRTRCAARSAPRSTRGARATRWSIARTDAVAVEGFERAIERAARYREAGADMLFVEAPKDARRPRPASSPHCGGKRAADGQHGRRRQDAAAVRSRARGDRLRAGDLPGRHRAGVRPHGARTTTARSPRTARPSRTATTHARFRRTQRADRHAGDARAGQALRDAPASDSKTDRADERSIRSRSRCSTAVSCRSPTRWTPRSTARRSIRSSPRRTTPATGSITPRPARRWCRAPPACRSSSAPWRSRSRP